ncbi:AMP-binding protein [Mycobacterium sp. AT1]|uniref:AMP-binding protein n=1 Tax=Mycobacterium sp. AT1 TaxID=1961706 RepID=UPI0009AC37FC|nr:AMP-binding protein [Mycobacterium sp. AT1]OPX10797.1 hypothetical protein B1790_10605 [Mycobacterium sp. AT1]
MPSTDIRREPTTIWAALERVADTWPDTVALTDLTDTPGTGTDAVTFAELRDRTERTSAKLVELGVGRGDTVATLVPTCTEWVETFLAVARIGALLVPLNTRYRTEELSHLLRLSGARVLLTASEFEGVDFADRLGEIAVLAGDDAVGVRHVVNVAGDPERLPGAWNTVPVDELTAHQLPLPPAGAEPDDPVIVFGTSGTTSAPKLAVHTHHTVTGQAAAVAERLDFGPGPAGLQVLSLSGTFGFVPFLSGLLVGKPAVLLPIFRLPRVLDALADHDCDLLVAAEGSLRELLDVLTVDTAGGLRRMVTAGLDIRDIVAAADAVGIEAANVYGSSEIFAFAATTPPGADLEARTIPGGPLTAPGMAARVRDPQTGEILPHGEVGDLEIGGDVLFVEYLHNTASTASCRTSDGWFRTGDSAKMLDARTFHYLARANDTLRMGGYTVSPADVESTIEQLDAVAQAQVVGVRDPRSGNDLGVAFVRPRPDAALEVADVVEHCRARLASFKVPVHVEVVESYPTIPSANGDKVRRDVLRDTAERLLAGTDRTVNTKEHASA